MLQVSRYWGDPEQECRGEKATHMIHTTRDDVSLKGPSVE